MPLSAFIVQLNPFQGKKIKFWDTFEKKKTIFNDFLGKISSPKIMVWIKKTFFDADEYHGSACTQFKLLKVVKILGQFNKNSSKI